jgi:hypothetical protein
VPSQELDMVSSTVMHQSFGCDKCKLKLYCQLWKQSIMLSLTMRDLISIREILKEIMLEVLNETFKPE